MRGNPFAGVARVGWMEFWSHLKSPRLLILVVLLALLVFAASYGLSQPISFGSGPYPTLAVHPAIRNESGVDHYLVVGWLSDQRGVPRGGATLSVYRQDFRVPPTSQYGTFVVNLTTDANGFAEYDTGTTYSENESYGFLHEPYSFSTAGFYQKLFNQTFTAGGITSGTVSGPGGTASYFSTHVLTIDGYPATGADVSIDGNVSGHPDGNGFFIASIGEGQHVAEISYLGYNESYIVMGGSSQGPIYENGADAVLMALAGTLIQLILPIMAIAISFDTIARERAQGSLEVLLARRVQREGVLLGKFLGAFASVALPTVGVFLAGVAIITAITGRTPTGTFVAAAIGGGLFLVAVYVLLMLIFSTLAKNVGTAVVFGVVTWLAFNLLFSFIALFLLMALGGNYFDPSFYSTLLTIYLFDPNMVYQLLLGAAAPTTGGGIGIGIVPTGYLSLASIAVAAVLWLVVPLTLAFLVFRKRAES